MMRTFILVLGLLAAMALAADSLPWRGRIVFDERVRVDDAPGLKGHPATHPQTVMDANWNLYSVWADDRDNNAEFEVFFARSSDTGRTWSLPNLNLSQSPSPYYLYPWLAADESGLYVVWQGWSGGTWKLFQTRSTDRGATWSVPIQVPGITVVNDFNSGINSGPQPKLAVDSRSNPGTTYLYLAWADNATGTIQIKLARSTDFGASFQDLGIVDKNPDNVNRNPFIALDDAGWLHCAWARGTGGTNQDPHPWVGYNRSTDRGETFLAEDIIVNDDVTGVYRGNPSVTYSSSNGYVLVSWEDSRRAGGNADPDIWFSRIHRDSAEFNPNKRVNWWDPDTSARYSNYKPVVRMDPRGVMVAAWHDDPEADGSFGIHLAAYTDSLGRFSGSRSLVQTFTGIGGGNFGNDFYSPSLFVKALISGADTTTHFFIVWQDFVEDTLGGNVYSVRGRVVTRPPWPYGWREVRPVPSLPSNLPVKDGGWLAMNENNGLICVAKGNKCPDFYSYDPMDTTAGAWFRLTDWPPGTAEKQPGKGACAASDNAGQVYATKGRNSAAFWRYNVGANTWTQLADVPLGPSDKKDKGGNDLAYVPEGDSGYVYLLKGYRTEFYRYSVTSGQWESLAQAPDGSGKQKYDKGSFLAYDGAGHIYCHQAKYTDPAKTRHFMFRYNLATRTWDQTLAGMPVLGMDGGRMKSKKSKDGGAGAFYNGYIYALKGGNTCQLFRYHPADSTWNEEDTMPSFGSTMKKKKVKMGGDLVSYGDWWAFFALKGSKTYEMWRFVDSMPLYSPARPGGVTAKSVRSGLPGFSLAPGIVTHGSVTLRFGAAAYETGGVALVTVADVTGRILLRRTVVPTALPVVLDVAAFAPGRYFCRFTSAAGSSVRTFAVAR